MHHAGQDRASLARRTRTPSLRNTGWLAATLLLLAFGGCVPTKPTQRDAMEDIFQLLDAQGYAANIGLSGIYAPGNVIQTSEATADGVHHLPTPIVFLWGSDCFPGQTPRTSPFVLPDSSGRRAGSLSIGAEFVQRLLPALSLDRAAVADYRLTLGDTAVHTFARADLSHQFSQKCVHGLTQAMEDGDRIDWFAVIVEAVVADSLALEMSWREGTSLGVRTAQKGAAEAQLGRILRAAAGAHSPVDASVSVVADGEQASVLRAEGPVIVGYRMRPLQPVYEK